MPSFTDPVIMSGALAGRSQPVLESGDLVLRPWQSADAPAVEAAFTDPSIQRWHVRSLTSDEARGWVDSWPGRWRAETDAGWAIVDESGLLGQVGLRRVRLEEGFACVSYWVVPAVRGRRIAPRALTAMTTWAFGDLGLHRLELSHSTANPASCRVADVAGYALEGTKRGYGLHTDGWHDMHLHARLSTDS